MPCENENDNMHRLLQGPVAFQPGAPISLLFKYSGLPSLPAQEQGDPVPETDR